MIKDTSAQDIPTQTASKKNVWLKVIIAAAICVSLVFYVVNSTNKGELSVQKTRLQLATVERGNLVRDVSATGKIVAANAPQVYSPEQGYVDLLVKPGDKVELNQAIAKIESPELKNALKQQQSELQKLQGNLERQKLEARRKALTLTKTLDIAEVELNAAKREDRRAQISIAQNLISQIDLEKAVDDLARAKLSFDHAKQEVALAKDTLAFDLKSAERTVERQQLVVDDLVRQVSNLVIKAPVSGIVGNHLVQQKAAVTQSQALMTLVDLSAFEAELQVPESYANELGLGMQVELRFGANQVVGTLSAISPEVSGREVTTRVRFPQDNIVNLRQNQQLSARILLESRPDVLMVKRGAFLQQGGNIAFKVNGNSAEKITIQTGVTSIGSVELNSGVKEGDVLIVSSYEDYASAQTILIR